MNFPAIRRIPERLTVIGGTYEERTLPWEIDKAEVTSNSLDVSAKDPNILDIDISVGGQEFYVLGDFNKTIYQYTLCDAYDLDTGQYTDSHSVIAETVIPAAFTFYQNGTMLLVADIAGLVYVYTLGTAYALSTIEAYTGTQDFSLAAQVTASGSTLSGLSFGNDDSKLYMSTVGGSIYEYDVTFLDPGINVSEEGLLVGVAGTPDYSALQIHGDGNKLFVADTTENKVYIFDLPIFFELISAAEDVGVFLDTDTEMTIASLSSFIIAYDGFSVYAVDFTTSIIYSYSME